MSTLNRRTFLTHTSLASAAALAYSARSDESNGVVRLGIIGIRGRGADLLGQWAGMKDVKIAALCDVDSNVSGKAMKAAEAKEQKPRFEQDLRRLLDDKNIDAVAVATCNHWHALAAVWAAQAGKHVYVEKPVSHNVVEGRRMVEAARKYNRVIMPGTQRRSSEAIAKAVAFLRAGKLGPVKLGRAIVHRSRGSIGKKADAPVPAGVDYNLWQGPAPERPFNPNRFHYEWHWNWDYGNGELGNNGIHYLDIIRWGMNKNELPLKVMSVGGRFGYEDDAQSPNTHAIVYDYGDSQMICEIRGLKTGPFQSSSFKPPPNAVLDKSGKPKTDVGMIFHCTEGALALYGDEPVAFNLKGEKIETFSGGGGNHYRRFIDAVKAGKLADPVNDILEGHLSTALCHIGNISHRLGEMRPLDSKENPFSNDAGAESYDRMKAHLKENGIDLGKTQVCVGKSLALDPKTESFAGDPAASALLAREYRKPFVMPEKV